jgi:type VI secretion system protein ImpM
MRLRVRRSPRVASGDGPGSAMSDIDAVPGWYGKLPTLGDFASRRLGADFIEPWDLWLGDGMAAQREVLGEAWLEAYLASPVWRFVLMPGTVPSLAPQRPLAGVLMPSVDRVGRYFPLTIVAGLPRVPRTAPEMELLLGWLHRLEDVALDALHEDWSIDELETVLAQLPPALDDVNAWPEHLAAPRAALLQALESDATFVPLDAVKSRAELASLWAASLSRAGADAWAQAAAGRSFWLSDNPDAPRLLVARGLPGRDEFIQMLGATGREPNADTTF